MQNVGIDSDHNMLVLYLDISCCLKKPDRNELFNFLNVECQSCIMRNLNILFYFLIVFVQKKVVKPGLSNGSEP